MQKSYTTPKYIGKRLPSVHWAFVIQNVGLVKNTFQPLIIDVMLQARLEECILLDNSTSTRIMTRFFTRTCRHAPPSRGKKITLKLPYRFASVFGHQRGTTTQKFELHFRIFRFLGFIQIIPYTMSAQYQYCDSYVGALYE